MYTPLDTVTLKNSESVELGLIKGPDADWAPRIDGDLLAHKGPTWRWGNHIMLTQDLGIDALFYVLHRNGDPFANVMTIEYKGIGLLGHVYTKPEDRRKGAATLIFDVLMPHFRNRGGRALILGTGYDSPAYHIYKSYGFEGIEPQSGTMTYYPETQKTFESQFLTPGPTTIHRLGPKHYPVAPILFLNDCPGTVRMTPAKIFGRGSSEGAFIPLLRSELERQAENQPPRTAILTQQETEAVVGYATTDRDPTWPNTCVVDLFCLPNFWNQSPDLLHFINWPTADRYVSYCDAGWKEKEDALSNAGFQMCTTLPQWLNKSRTNTEKADVNVWVKK
ncbi:MAG: GNAT superfamily N-acetyltransferase [Candidatus Latescibacterota bacterium]|jgi:GNAT superfamily N-acetyltransferase